jgi:hypothetical protein
MHEVVEIIHRLTGIAAPSDALLSYTRSVVNFNVMPPLMIITLAWHDFLYFIYVNIESRLYRDDVRTMYDDTSPV